MRNLFRKETQSKMFTTSEAKEIAKKLGIDFSKEKFVNEFENRCNKAKQNQEA